MRYNRLGRTDITVSNICLGTMTWGQQNSEQEAREQMDYAVDQGVNFFDTAELYPVPMNRDTQGRTEDYIGRWLAARGGRDKMILATKVTGRLEADWFRDDGSSTRLNRQQITEALEKSLTRLKTDYVDLYQLHWPDRPLNLFSQSRGYRHNNQEDSIPLLETLEILNDLVAQGKIRHVGLSNETAWGLMTCLHHSQHDNMPRIQSLQNAYCLVNRLFEQDLAEVSLREGVSLLAYSPLAGGVLSGKYLDGAVPEGSRHHLLPGFAHRYTKPGVEPALRKYQSLAETRGMSLVQLALKFIDQRPFVAATIIGATTMDQLRENMAAFDGAWDDEMEQAVTEIHLENLDPAP